MGRSLGKSLSGRLERLIAAYGCESAGLTGLAEAMDLPYGTVANWHKRGSVPERWLHRAAAATGQPADWLFYGGANTAQKGHTGLQVKKSATSAHSSVLVTGDAPEVAYAREATPPGSSLVSSSTRRTGGKGANVGSAVAVPASKMTPVVGTPIGLAELLTLPPAFEIQPRNREYVVIPSIEELAHAGRDKDSKAVQRRIAAAQVGVLAMDRAWMAEKLGRSDGGFATVEVSGNSMMPTLYDGDTIVIDTLIDRIKGEGIYVLRRGDELMVKRVLLDPVDESAQIKSDNESYGSKTLQPATVRELRVVGKMVWPRLR